MMHGALLLSLWGYVPCVCFEFLGPVENMQRKEGLRGFCCMKNEGVGVGVELSAEQESKSE